MVTGDPQWWLYFCISSDSFTVTTTTDHCYRSPLAKKMVVNELPSCAYLQSIICWIWFECERKQTTLVVVVVVVVISLVLGMRECAHRFPTADIPDHSAIPFLFNETSLEFVGLVVVRNADLIVFEASVCTLLGIVELYTLCAYSLAPLCARRWCAAFAWITKKQLRQDYFALSILLLYWFFVVVALMLHVSSGCMLLVVRFFLTHAFASACVYVCGLNAIFAKFHVIRTWIDNVGENKQCI